MDRRQCTEHYKIRPIQRKIRELLGLTKGQRVPSGTAVELWLGISTDEAIRMKPSRDRWIQNRCPPSSKLGCPRSNALRGGRPATTGHWSVQPALAAHTSHVRGGSRPSADGPSCSLRRSRLTPTSEDGWPSPRSPTWILDGCPSRRRSASMRRSWERTGNRTGSETSARGTVGSEGFGTDRWQRAGPHPLAGMSPPASPVVRLVWPPVWISDQTPWQPLLPLPPGGGTM